MSRQLAVSLFEQHEAQATKDALEKFFQEYDQDNKIDPLDIRIILTDRTIIDGHISTVLCIHLPDEPSAETCAEMDRKKVLVQELLEEIGHFHYLPHALKRSRDVAVIYYRDNIRSSPIVYKKSQVAA